MQKILIVAAHPDDEVLGCGATIPKLAWQGHAVRALLLGPGRNEYTEYPESLAELLGHGTIKPATFSWSVYSRFPDNQMDTVPLLEVIKTIEHALEIWMPDVIYTHWVGDLNIDHQITAKAVITATRPGGKYPVPELYAFEVLSASEWAFVNQFAPDTFVAINDFCMSRKILAMKTVYKDEMRPYPHPRSSEAIEALAMRRGSQAGFKYAEAFKTIRRLVEQ